MRSETAGLVLFYLLLERMYKQAKRISQSFSEEDVDVLADIVELVKRDASGPVTRFTSITRRPAFAKLANRIVRMRAKMKG